jgi:hypothetical protein
MNTARVFPRKTSMSPTDQDCYFGYPPFQTPKYDQVHISVCFTWDIPRAQNLAAQWASYGPVTVGGPAYDDPGDNFTPGLYIREGVTITSRGCPHKCSFCFVPAREGKIRELRIHAGNVVQDNNLLACSKQHVLKVFEMLRGQRQIHFAGGLEPDRVTDWVVEELRSLRIAQIWLSYDQPDRKVSLKKAVGKLTPYFRRNQLRCYVLIGHEGDTAEKAEGRLREAWEIGTLPFAMRYRTAEARWGGTFLYKDRAWNELAKLWSTPGITRSIMRKESVCHGMQAEPGSP